MDGDDTMIAWMMANPLAVVLGLVVATIFGMVAMTLYETHCDRLAEERRLRERVDLTRAQIDQLRGRE